MAHLIDKDALVSEIDKILDYADEHWDVEYATGARRFSDKLEDAIDTLEVKDVDLKRYYNEYFKGWTDYQGIDSSVSTNSGDCATLDDIKDACRHFFELGLKARQE